MNKQRIFIFSELRLFSFKCWEFALSICCLDEKYVFRIIVPLISLKTSVHRDHGGSDGEDTTLCCLKSQHIRHVRKIMKMTTFFYFWTEIFYILVSILRVWCQDIPAPHPTHTYINKDLLATALIEANEIPSFRLWKNIRSPVQLGGKKTNLNILSRISS